MAGLALAGSAQAASIDPKAVDAVVHEHQDAFQDCYDEGLKRKPKLRGKVVVFFRIEKSGEVTEAVAKKGTTLADETVQRCLLDAFERMHFPDFTGACDESDQDCFVRITYPLTFTPG